MDQQIINGSMNALLKAQQGELDAVLMYKYVYASRTASRNLSRPSGGFSVSSRPVSPRLTNLFRPC